MLSDQLVNSSNMTDNEYYYDYDPDQAYDFMFYYILWTFVCPTIFGIIIVAGTIGNALVIYVILSRSAMQTVTNILLLNLGHFGHCLSSYMCAADRIPLRGDHVAIW